MYVNGWLRYKMAKKYFLEVSTPCVGRTNITDDRRICDSKDPNAT